MEFREGMLGVVVVALALTCALGVSYLAGVQSVDVEVTKYDYMADVSGLFDYDKSPQYIDYDPSSNYVGYYSKDTGEYWPVDDVDYEQSQRVNNYRVNLEPEVISIGSITLDTYTEGVVDPFDTELELVWFKNRAESYKSPADVSERAKTVTLKSYIKALDVESFSPGADVSVIELRSIGTYRETGGNTYEADWINFSINTMWKITDSYSELNLASQGWFDDNHYKAPYDYYDAAGDYAWTYYLPCLSCSIDLTTGIVTLYYDNDCTDFFAMAYIDNVYMTYGGQMPLISDKIITFGKSAGIKTIHVEKSYLDPNYGVTMED